MDTKYLTPYKASPYKLSGKIPTCDPSVWYYLSNSGKRAEFHLDVKDTLGEYIDHITFTVRFPKPVR